MVDLVIVSLVHQTPEMVEWMAENIEYALEIVRFARAKALEDGHPDLAEWADKLERASLEAKPGQRPLAQTALALMRERAAVAEPVRPAAPAKPAAAGPAKPVAAARVHGAIDELMARHTDGSRVLISTSGGVIALALQRVLGLPDAQVIAANWMVNNSSITRLRYGGGRLSLTLFNGLPHLEKPQLRELITYR